MNKNLLMVILFLPSIIITSYGWAYLILKFTGLELSFLKSLVFAFSFSFFRCDYMALRRDVNDLEYIEIISLAAGAFVVDFVAIFIGFTFVFGD